MINLEWLAWLFRHQPDDAVPEDIVAAVLPELDAPGRELVATLREAPLAYIRALLAVFDHRSDFLCVFVRAATANLTDGEALVRAWRYAFTMFGEIEWISFAWKTRLLIRRRAKEPRLITALIATLGTGVKAWTPWYALALASGDEAVIDALLPHFEVARRDDAMLDALREAARFAPKTPAFEVPTGWVATLITERARRSALGHTLRERGVQTVEWSMHFRLHSKEWRGVVSMSWVELGFDTTHASSLLTHGLAILRGSNLPELESARDLPKWLARIQREQGVTWDWPGHFHGTLKGDEREVFLRWLRSEGA